MDELKSLVLTKSKSDIFKAEYKTSLNIENLEDKDSEVIMRNTPYIPLHLKNEQIYGNHNKSFANVDKVEVINHNECSIKTSELLKGIINIPQNQKSLNIENPSKSDFLTETEKVIFEIFYANLNDMSGVVGDHYL